MSTKIYSLFFASLLLCGLVSCGGGGGGGGSSADSKGVRFIHAALDSSPRSLTVDGIETGTYTQFGKSSDFKNVGSGIKALSLIGRAGDLDAVPATEFSGDDRVDVVLFQGIGSVRALTFKHPTTHPAGQALRVINAVRAESGGVATVISPAGRTISYGSSGEYESVTGLGTVTISGSARAVALPPDGVLYTAVALGEAGYLTQILLLKDE